MRIVVIESPFAGDVPRNLRYLRACMRDCLLRGEAPYASHALYTQPGVLDDGKPAERERGIKAGFEWRTVADATVVYSDLGMTTGMKYGIAAAEQRTSRGGTHPIEYRVLGEGWEQRAIECEAQFTTTWPMFSATDFPCGWDRPGAINGAVAFQESRMTPDEAEGLAYGMLLAARDARAQGRK